jgi:CobQ-like glutamine amidotransferase family enzyme
MTTSLTIVSVLPELLGTNGDAANARVLRRRAEWAGFDAQVIDVRTAADLPPIVDAVVVGSGTDGDLVVARDVLATMTNEFRTWSTGAVPILAVGTGWELLSWGIEQSDGPVIEGLGLVAGRAVPRTERVTDDLVVKTKYGRLIGFENHARDYVGAEGSPLGRVLSGSGNGAGFEGLVMGEFFGTHLHGPVLARNPQFADHLLEIMAARHGASYRRGEDAAFADDMAQAARNQIAVRLALTAE